MGDDGAGGDALSRDALSRDAARHDSVRVDAVRNSEVLPDVDIVQGAYLRAASAAEFEAAVPLAATLSDGRRICLVQHGADVFAVEDRCSHRDFAISGGDVVAPCVIECPWHGARFDVRTGAALTGPAEESIQAFPVRVVGGVVFVGPSAG